MDALDRRPRAIDICAQVAHLPMRVYVMGDRAVRREPATPDDIAEMRRLTIEALHVGAFGFTTSRTDSHKTPDGELVASRDADDHELLGIGSALGVTGTGAFGMNSDFDDEEYELRWMRKLAKETGRPVWFLLTDRYEDPQRWRRLLKAVHEARAEGLPLTAQMAGRPIGVMMGIGTALNPFTVRPSYKALESLPIEEQRRRLRDPAMRREDPGRPAVRGRDRQARAVPPGRGAALRQVLRHGQSAGLRARPGKERRRDRAARGPHARGGRLRLHAGGRPVSLFPGGELRHRRPRPDPGNAERSGLPARPVATAARTAPRSSMPACRATCSRTGAATARAGRRLPLEKLVKRQTSETADFFGLTDRGRLAPGLRADVNLIDFDAMRLHKPELVHDMPANGRRFIQKVEGYQATICAGMPIFEQRRAHRRAARQARARRPGRRHPRRGGIAMHRPAAAFRDGRARRSQPLHR